MAGRRTALVVAVDTYDNPGLSRLTAPAADADALSEVLGDPELGGFEVVVLHNPRASEVVERVEDVLVDRESDDVVLLHFSGHGLTDAFGELYLAARNTDPERLVSTSVDAAVVNRLMRRSRAGQVVLFLDCCFGGAFERGVVPRSAGEVDVGRRFDGTGRVVITASSAYEYAFEGARTAGAEVRPSVFTAAVVEGIRTGLADRDNDGQVGLHELYEYVYEQVKRVSPAQTPSKWEFDLQGVVRIARNPNRRVVPGTLPDDVLELCRHPNYRVRSTAVAELAGLVGNDDLALAAAARVALVELADDDSRSVSAAAGEVLARIAPRVAEQVDLGVVRPGAVGSREVPVTGGPLALASAAVSDTAALRARVVDGVLRLTWSPDGPGVLDAVVRLSGPAGEAGVRVTGRSALPETREPNGGLHNGGLHEEVFHTAATPPRVRPVPEPAVPFPRAAARSVVEPGGEEDRTVVFLVLVILVSLGLGLALSAVTWLA